MKNRKVEREEIIRITENCPLREKAFFAIMRQSGLPPHRIKQLKIGDVEEILDPNRPAPYKINAMHEIPNFMGEEAAKYLRECLNRRRREKPTRESLLFTNRNNPKKEINTKSVSRTFKLAMQKARFKEPSQLKLYSLVRFYKDNTKDYQKELKKLSSCSTSKTEGFRNLYEELAMPRLEIESTLAMEIHQLNKRVKKMQSIFPKKQEDEYGKYLEEHPEEYAKLVEEHKKRMEDDRKLRREHPEEAKLKDEQMEYPKELEEQDERFYVEHLEETLTELQTRFIELENKFRELEGTVKKIVKRRK